MEPQILADGLGIENKSISPLYLKVIRIVLLVLVVIGLGLLATQKLWVPKLVDRILQQGNHAGSLVSTDPSDWKTYTSTKYRFTLNLTEAWKGYQAKEVNDGVDFLIPSSAGLYPIMHIGTTTVEMENSWMHCDCPRPDFLGTKDEIVYTVSLSQGPPEDISDYQATLNIHNVLSSFKFIQPQPDTTRWKTYTNSKYGFSLKYPADWIPQDLHALGEEGYIDLELYKQYKPVVGAINPESLQGMCKFDLFTDHSTRNANETIRDWDARAGDTINRTSTTNVIYGSLKGIYVIGGELGVSDYVMLPFAQTGVLSVDFYCGNDVREEGRTMLDQILSTLKFTK